MCIRDSLPSGLLNHGELYEVMGLPPTASKPEILRAFHNGSRNLHPDKHPDGHTREAYSAMTHAYAVLGDVILRYYYDVLCGFRRDDPSDTIGPRSQVTMGERDMGFEEIPPLWSRKLDAVAGKLQYHHAGGT
eukprot:5034517-Alexandrium_andersonii.AAC.1